MLQIGNNIRKIEITTQQTYLTCISRWNKQNNCKQTSLSLTKEKCLFYYEVQLCFNDLYFSFWICAVSCGCKIAATSEVLPPIFLVKNRKHAHFLKRYPQIKLLIRRWPHSKIWTQPQTKNLIHDPTIWTNTKNTVFYTKK